MEGGGSRRLPPHAGLPPEAEPTLSVVDVVRRLIGRKRAPARLPRCISDEVRSEEQVRRASQLLAAAADAEPAALQALIRELVALNTPGLFLNIVQRGGPIRVVLEPWDGRTTRFRGSSYFIDAGAHAPDGVEALLATPLAHVTTLYPAAPDHPVYVVSIENQGTLVYHGRFPPYLTHITLVVNGSVVARCLRLLHERGPQEWRSAVA